jgi:VanZ family protein
MIILGGLVELGQAYCTTTRSGEWLDLIADAVGCTLAIGIGIIMKWLR